MKTWDGMVFLTDHAIRRSQERGVPRIIVELTARHGKAIRTRHGTFKRFCTKETIRTLKWTGIGAQTAEKCTGVSIITSDNL